MFDKSKMKKGLGLHKYGLQSWC